MTYSTLMVHLELEHQNDARLQIAGELAEQFDAKLIGIAAADPQPTYYANGSFAQSLVERERAEIEQRMAATEARFRAAVQKRARLIEWRCAEGEKNFFDHDVEHVMSDFADTPASHGPSERKSDEAKSKPSR